MGITDESIMKLLELTTSFTPQQIAVYAEWLQNTPKTTVVRVNLLKTTIETVKAHIDKILQDAEYLPVRPVVEQIDSMPEVLLIRNINSINQQPQLDCKEIIVDVSCGAAILRGAHIYGPGVLAMQSNTKIDEIVKVFADLDGKCKRGTNSIYESTKKLFIGIGTVKMQRYQLFDQICTKGIAIQMIETISGVPSIGDNYLLNHYALLQNLPSIVCGRVLNPKPGDFILDMCAAPGNKTTHLAQLMNDTGIIIALDKSERRVTTLRENVERFGLKCVRCYAFDATKAITVEHNDDGPPFKKESFDKILLDAPCSGMGNRPILATKLTAKMIESYPKLQKKLLDTAAHLVKVGGVLVYSTCTIFEAENESNIVWFLKKFCNQFELVKAEPIFGCAGLANVGFSDEERMMVQRFGPNFDEITNDCLFNDSIGFFICKLRKKCSIEKS